MYPTGDPGPVDPKEEVGCVLFYNLEENTLHLQGPIPDNYFIYTLITLISTRRTPSTIARYKSGKILKGPSPNFLLYILNSSVDKVLSLAYNVRRVLMKHENTLSYNCLVCL